MHVTWVMVLEYLSAGFFTGIEQLVGNWGNPLRGQPLENMLCCRLKGDAYALGTRQAGGKVDIPLKMMKSLL